MSKKGTMKSSNWKWKMNDCVFLHWKNMKPSFKYLVLYRYKNKYPILFTCKIFEVSKRAYYDFIKWMKKTEKDEFEATLIAQCQKHSYKTYSCWHVSIEPKKYANITVHCKTVLRVMNKYRLLSEICCRKKHRIIEKQLHKCANLLNWDFNAENQIKNRYRIFYIFLQNKAFFIYLWSANFFMEVL